MSESNRRHKVVLVLGNKTDQEALFEAEITETERRIMDEHKNECCEYTDAEPCKHILFSSCSLFTKSNLEESIQLVTLALLDSTAHITAERLQAVLNRNSRAPSEFDMSQFSQPTQS